MTYIELLNSCKLVPGNFKDFSVLPVQCPWTYTCWNICTAHILYTKHCKVKIIWCLLSCNCPVFSCIVQLEFLDWFSFFQSSTFVGVLCRISKLLIIIRQEGIYDEELEAKLNFRYSELSSTGYGCIAGRPVLIGNN